jgi:TolB protein
MNGMFRSGVIACFLFACMVFAGPLRAQVEGGNIGVVEGTATPQDTALRVLVDSPAATLKRLATRAFSFHGGFEVRSAGRVDFVFNFLPAGTAAVDLVISSSGQELLRQRFAGRSIEEALAKAADMAVQRTTNLPGWFNGTVAFVSDRTGHPEIYVGDLLLENVRQQTSDRSKSVLPALSPDATQLVYTSYFQNGFPDLYSIDLRTNRRVPFAQFKGMNSGATFSPDGRRVAMVLSGSGNAEIYTANPLGASVQRITRTRAIEADPTWSPDGRQVAFTSDEMGRPQIFLMNVDGSGRRRLPTNVSRNCSEPTWNPRDPRQIAFTAAIGREFEICLYTMGEGDARILTRGEGDVVEPVWLPDGRHLVVTMRSSSFSRLAILDARTGRLTPLTPLEWRRCSMADFAPAALP